MILVFLGFNKLTRSLFIEHLVASFVDLEPSSILSALDGYDFSSRSFGIGFSCPWG